MRRALTSSLPFLATVHTPEEDLAFIAGTVLPTQRVLVGCRGSVVVGFIAHDDAWVHQLYLVPEAQGHGLGSKLLEAAKAPTDALRLWCFQANHRARRFYARHGFRELRFTDGALNDEKAPDVLLAWSRG